MRLYHSLPAALIGAAAIAIVQPQIAVALTPEQINDKAEQFTVSIQGNGSIGSGVIVQYIEGTYYVLTAQHVVRSAGTYEVITFDKKRYRIESAQIINLPGVDLAVLPLKTAEKYTPAELGIREADRVSVANRVYVSGYPNTTNLPGSVRVFSPGNISVIQTMKDGYGLVYNAITAPGMSGGPVLNDEARLIAIHGRTEGTIGDSTKPGFNSGIPIKTFIDLVPKAFSEKAIEKMKQENYQGAIADFSLALQFNPNSADAYIGRGYAYFAQKDYEKASQDATVALKLNPQLAQAYRLRGISRAEQGKHREAIQDFNSAIQIDPKFADAYSLRAVSQARVQEDRAALADASRGIDLAPSNPSSFLRSNVVRRLLGDEVAARGDLERSQQLGNFRTEDPYLLAINKGYINSLQLGNPIVSVRRREVDPPPAQEAEISNQTGGNSRRNLLNDSTEIVIRLDESATNWSLANNLAVSSKVYAVAFSPSDPNLVASGSGDGKIRLWDLKTGRVRRTLPGHGSEVRSIAFSQDGKKLASGDLLGIAKVWDVEKGTELKVFGDPPRDRISSIAFSQSGQTLTAGLSDGRIITWLVESGKIHRNFQERHTGVVTTIVYSPNGQTIATAGADNTIKVWSVRSQDYGKLLNTFTGHTALINSITFSPDGQTLVSSSLDRSIKVWDFNTGKLRRSIDLGSGVTANELAISPDGQVLASSNNGIREYQIKLWNLLDGTGIGILSGHTGLVRSVAFSSDGRLVSGSEDNTVRIWQRR